MKLDHLMLTRVLASAMALISIISFSQSNKDKAPWTNLFNGETLNGWTNKGGDAPNRVPGVSYGLSIADNLDGPWYQVSGYTFFSDWDKYELPAEVRHGCMITIPRDVYDNLVQKFGLPEEK